MHSICVRSLGVVASMFLAVPALAADPARADARQVCRSEKNTGTRIATSECHTPAEWAEIDAARALQAQRFQRSMNNPAADRPVSNSPFPR
ncbi:MAG: hypothetical protein JWL91_2535 [Sphingomonas bacterium]|jgi:hypothetical protein|nr:hypothetical protein [Sphingomonas bacterium]MDB5690659.1 hypothetical protein [Sphingomonas bacterium]